MPSRNQGALDRHLHARACHAAPASEQGRAPVQETLSMVQVARRALAACAFLAASGVAWPQSLPGSLASRPAVLQPVRAAQASDSTRPTWHRRTNRPRRSSASGEVASAFDTLASVVNTTPAPSRYRSRADRLASVRTLAAAEADPQLRIVISLNDRLLWAIIGSDTLLTAPV